MIGWHFDFDPVAFGQSAALCVVIAGLVVGVVRVVQWARRAERPGRR